MVCLLMLYLISFNATFECVHESHVYATFETKAIKQYFHVVLFILLSRVVLTFRSVLNPECVTITKTESYLTSTFMQ